MLQERLPSGALFGSRTVAVMVVKSELSVDTDPEDACSEIAEAGGGTSGPVIMISTDWLTPLEVTFTSAIPAWVPAMRATSTMPVGAAEGSGSPLAPRGGGSGWYSWGFRL